MNRRTRTRLRYTRAVAAMGLVLLGGGSEASRSAPPGPLVDPAPQAADAGARERTVPAVDPAWREIGERSRQVPFAQTRQQVQMQLDRSAPGSARAQTARTWLGLLAHAHGEPALAAELLAGDAATPALDDWRLEILAEAAAAGGQTATARQALRQLIERHPNSPLRAEAVVRLARLEWESGSAAAAEALIERGLDEPLPRSSRVALATLAFDIASAGRDAARLRETARRLLVLDPLGASKLRVVDRVAARGGGSDWRLWLTSFEMVARAEALLDSDLPAGALTTLAAVAVSERDLTWHLLQARALTASSRGAEAWAVLVPVKADAANQARLEWERARAAQAAGDPARNPTAGLEIRQYWQRVERERLLATVRAAAADDPLQATALRRLASACLDSGRRDEATAALRQLQQVAASDSSGARPLWEAGWQDYRAGRYDRAIEAWRDLADLYPHNGWTRAGHYWSARAHDQRREPEAARRLYLAIVGTSTSDFYARQAALRLAGATVTATREPAPEAWPEDPLLARVRLLSDLGLDALARTELELLGERGERRARAALSALVLSRSGDTRASLRELKRAFPQLGTALQTSAPREALALYYPLDFRETITTAAATSGLPAPLVFGIVHQESGFDASALSRSGARGLMQLMPATGREVAGKLGLPWSTQRLTDPEYSVRLGTHYFRGMLRQFDDNVELALAAYNGGPGRISRLWRAEGPNAELDRFLEGLALEESRNYVKRILVLADSYRSRYPDLG